MKNPVHLHRFGLVAVGKLAGVITRSKMFDKGATGASKTLTVWTVPPVTTPGNPGLTLISYTPLFKSLSTAANVAFPVASDSEVRSFALEVLSRKQRELITQLHC